MILAGTSVVIAAVTQNDLVGLRSDIQKVGGQLSHILSVVSDMQGWQREFTEKFAGYERHTDYRLKELTTDQVEFARQCRANHVVLAPALPMKRVEADDDKVSKSQLAIGVVLIVSFVSYVGHGIYAAWTWAKSVKP